MDQDNLPDNHQDAAHNNQLLSMQQSAREKPKHYHQESYTLGKEKALRKLANACTRPIIGKLEVKHKNAVLSFSFSAFNMITEALHRQYKIVEGKPSTNTVIYVPTYESNDLIVAETYKIHKGSEYLYTINLYRPTCCMVANGKHVIDVFVEQEFPKIEQLILENINSLNEGDKNMNQLFKQGIKAHEESKFTSHINKDSNITPCEVKPLAALLATND